MSSRSLTSVAAASSSSADDESQESSSPQISYTKTVPKPSPTMTDQCSNNFAILEKGIDFLLIRMSVVHLQQDARNDLTHEEEEGKMDELIAARRLHWFKPSLSRILFAFLTPPATRICLAK